MRQGDKETGRQFGLSKLPRSKNVQSPHLSISLSPHLLVSPSALLADHLHHHIVAGGGTVELLLEVIGLIRANTVQVEAVG